MKKIALILPLLSIGILASCSQPTPGPTPQPVTKELDFKLPTNLFTEFQVEDGTTTAVAYHRGYKIGNDFVHTFLQKNEDGSFTPVSHDFYKMTSPVTYIRYNSKKVSPTATDWEEKDAMLPKVNAESRFYREYLYKVIPTAWDSVIDTTHAVKDKNKADKSLTVKQYQSLIGTSQYYEAGDTKLIVFCCDAGHNVSTVTSYDENISSWAETGITPPQSI